MFGFLIVVLLVSVAFNVFFLGKIRGVAQRCATAVSELESQIEEIDNKFSFLKACGMRLPDLEKVEAELRYLGGMVVSARKAKEEGQEYHCGTWTFEALGNAEKNLQMAHGIAWKMKYPVSPEWVAYASS